MTGAVDTNILLDILVPDERHMRESKKLLETYLGKGRLIICEIVYAELASQFLSSGDLISFLSETGIRLAASNEKSLHIAGERWVRYSRKKERDIHCPQCGRKADLSCPYCGSGISMRQKVLSDFIIGGHALVHADILLSRDRGVYKTYFSDLAIVSSVR